METYKFNVRVVPKVIQRWFDDCGRRENTLFSRCNEREWLEDLGYEIELAGYFSLPAEKLIIHGLRHAGLLHYPGVQGYCIKEWNANQCVIEVDVVAIEDEPDPRMNINLSSYTPFWINGYSKQEQGIMERIQKFFSPTANVVMNDKMSMTGWSSD